MLIDDIALTLEPGIRPRTAAHLIACFGSAGELYGASAAEIVEKAEVNHDLASRIVARKYHKLAEEEVAYCHSKGITPIPCDSDIYPELLKECSDRPHVVYYRGDTKALGKRRMLSMVGTRQISAYGQRVCERIIAELAAMYPDLVIVSGLAYGVDGACHRTALAHGLATVGVLPNHISRIYPADHTRLAEEIISHGGGIMSEYNRQTKMHGGTFDARNRIIAGMSQGTFIVESPLKGGSMITARHAGGYDRSVMAAPGRIGDAGSEGTNRLIATERARMVCSAEDIARELMWDIEIPAKEHGAFDTSILSREAASLLTHIPDGDCVSVDMLAETAGIGVSALTPVLFELELEGAVRALPGKLYEKA